MSINRIILLGLTLFFTHLVSYADDSQAEIDKARVFPVQRNTTVIHSSSKEASDPNEQSSTAMSEW